MAKIKCELMAAVTHEMRTPLTTIVSLTEEKISSLEKPTEDLQLMQEASTRLLGIVENIIMLTGVESGMLKLEYTPFALNKFLEQMCQMFSKSANQKGLSFICDIEAGLPTIILADRAKMECVLRNIISNAIKFTADGTVGFSVKHQCVDNTKAATIVCTVSDSGCGINDDLMEQIFNPFRQADMSATRGYSGLGLGLPVAHRLVKLMGGSLEISGNGKNGTDIKIFFPVEVVS